jgi:hypothetical protein
MASKKHAVISRPVARTERLLVEAVGDETVIFDLESRSSHALKPLAAAVFNYADGSHTVAEISELVSYRLATPVTEEEVVEVVAQLAELDLLDAPELDVDGSGLSRRDALKTFAAVGAGAALISTVTAGTALASSAGQSKLGDDQACVVPGGGRFMSPTTGPYAGWLFPQPDATSYTVPGTDMTFTGLAGGAVFNGQGVNDSYYGTSCTYLNYNGQGIHDCNNFKEAKGVWQCVPCDGPTWTCCQVVCAPAGYGYDWGKGVPAPTGAGYLPYSGCGTEKIGSCPSPGSPDWTAPPYNYYGKYCTPGGGQS